MEKRLSFNQVPEIYDSIRPTYVDELYADIIGYSGIKKGSQVLEIGIGTGQATKPFLDMGCNVTAIELGDKLAKFSREKFKEYDNLNIINADFFDFECEDNTYDLIFSATAFHWIPEKEGYEKVYKLLKSGGAFARFHNRPYRDKSNEALTNDVEKLYKEYMSHSSKSKKMIKEFDINDAMKISDISKKYGFIAQECKLYKRVRALNTTQYKNLIRTYSDHIALGEKILEEFALKLEAAVNNHGGNINIYDTIDLQIARKQ